MIESQNKKQIVFKFNRPKSIDHGLLCKVESPWEQFGYMKKDKRWGDRAAMVFITKFMKWFKSLNGSDQEYFMKHHPEDEKFNGAYVCLYKGTVIDFINGNY